MSSSGSLEHSDWIPVEQINSSGSKALTKLEDVEKEHIIETLKKTGWKGSGERGAARFLD